MKTKLPFLVTFLIAAMGFAQQITVAPNPFDENEEITLTLSELDAQQAWGTTDVYLWAWHFDANGDFVGNPDATGTDFGNSPESAKFTNNNDGTYSYTFTPTTFYNDTEISSIGVLAKSKDGTNQTRDFLFNVGTFRLVLNSPTEQTNIFNAGNTLNIDATTSANANFELFANGTLINTQNGITNYTFSYEVNANVNFKLVASENGTENSVERIFNAFVNPSPTEASVPEGMQNGFNYDPANPDEATFVLYAPEKDFVHLIGNFNGSDWEISNDYILNKDSASDRFWITLDLSENTVSDLLYQYVVEYDIRIADPYSTLVLDSFNDAFIEDSVYPDLPEYPSDKTSQDVSYVALDETEYEWQNTNFSAPAKENLVIYELHIRDFDDNHSFNAVMNRLDYLDDLGINAIELMPVQEFDGNISWGYNPAFHMALDKYYGTRNAFKELVDACHARGIAVILDVVYNQATGQNPYFRLYNTSNGGTDGVPRSDNPFFNETVTHAYNVFNDFNHSATATRDYVKRVTDYWISEFKLDGFRYDLTKGFTQNCTAEDQDCTNRYQADRVAVLKQYADYNWAKNDNFIVIFEHLGGIQEENEWANYRADEGKGILLWNIQNGPYNEATMGYDNADFVGISYKEKGFDVPAAVGYMESHDEERLMFKNLAFGNANADYNVKDLPTALERMEAAGAFFFTVPGPKMIWQFGELGYDVSIFTCEDGTLPQPYPNPDCKLAPKPDGWDYLNDANRVALHDTWQKLIDLKLNQPIFKTDNFTVDASTPDGLKRIQLTDDRATGDAIKYVTIIGNLSVTAKSINPQFQENGTWFNMLDGSTINVANTNETISLAPGEFKIYANEATTLSIDNTKALSSLNMYPNPASQFIGFNKPVYEVTIYNISGQVTKSANLSQNRIKTVDISQLSSGFYLVKASNEQGSKTFKLVVK
ncbi:alpha-amylase family glycosyl hydrolase [Flavimarina sp. Hel_I_48]|uniref:alpha-amylase family glycosyl hydrolase n=1 Tax=Flavimarina sp. Hel_I_48 TaxID=1392488 RepID=UPI0004DF2CE3|nr:alpha-amylase family glycosyl hydrolase [Flavimarina sp. Hel_I_48]